VLSLLHRTLRRWLGGRLLSMGVVGLLTSIGLWLVGAPLPFTLGALTGLMNFVPNFGALTAAVITGLVALAASPLVALEAIVAQTLVGAFDGFVLTPLIQDRAISLPAGLILGAQVLIGAILGGLGLLLATPLAAVAFVLVRELYVRDVLEDAGV
jgi:predicted PurR-regulated permease PerM